ncbi:hypothetical protein PVK06_036569 [Gossypium arboreum]|uniref:Uncharacterized protein n=1 Tax=Gossypium arboreum TaxID=29729 RepID=A0ABR0NJV9_GOSAR|nr:hypothetical protein PVK06_036569 [Gossypium arboreum]
MAVKAKSNKFSGMGSSMCTGPSIKANTGLVSSPSLIQNTLSQNSNEPNTVLDLSVPMARKQAVQIDREGLSQTYCAATGTVRQPIDMEPAFSTPIDGNSNKVPGAILNSLSPVENLKRNELKVVVVAVRNLDFDRHSAVTFLEDNSETHRRNSPSTNRSSTLYLEEAIDLGKKNRSKKPYNIKNHCRTLHGNNTHFKNSGCRKVSLKTSMEQLAENIASFSKENLDLGAITKDDSSLGGGGNPEQ